MVHQAAPQEHLTKCETLFAWFALSLRTVVAGFAVLVASFSAKRPLRLARTARAEDPLLVVCLVVSCKSGVRDDGRTWSMCPRQPMPSQIDMARLLKRIKAVSDLTSRLLLFLLRSSEACELLRLESPTWTQEVAMLPCVTRLDLGIEACGASSVNSSKMIRQRPVWFTLSTTRVAHSMATAALRNFSFL